MIYGIVDRKNHKFYTHMSKVFHAIENVQKQYNWLITDCICYPKDAQIEKLLDQEYSWLSGDELSDIYRKRRFSMDLGLSLWFFKGYYG